MTVTGTGTAEAAPDVLVATLGTETSAGTVGEALDGAARAMSEMLAVLRAAGVADADLATSSASIWPTQDQHGRVAGYTASQQVTARLRDVDGAGRLLGDAVRAGRDAARLHGLSFQLSDSAPVAELARARAWEDARAKAAQLATLSGRALGQVVRIKEDGQPRPYPGGAVPLAAVDVARASIPVEPGATTVTVAIEAEWAFQD